jgi:transposase
MSVRSFQARVECDKQTMEHLWRTHKVFNERLPEIIKILFKMKRGECGQDDKQRTLYKGVAQSILEANAQNSDYLLNSVSIKGWKPGAAKKYNKGSFTWPDEAAALSSQGILIYDKKQVLGDLPGMMSQMICRQGVEAIKSQQEILKNWESEHKEWLKKKEEWESQEEHKKYLALRKKFEQFEQDVEGKITKKRSRWHLYINWLGDNRDLAAWRGGQAVINPLSEKAQNRITRARPNKKNTIIAEEFFKANPEIKKLDELHGYYERTFVRRRKRKRNPDGFDHKPTFTLPHPTIHPRWFVFNAPQTNPSGYRNLVLPQQAGALGRIELCLITGDKKNNKYQSDWVSVNFKADPRLSLLRRVRIQRQIRKGRNAGQTEEADAYEFYDKYLNRRRPATLGGVKLIFKLNPDKSPKAAYLYFTCDIPDERLTETAKKIQWLETGEVTKKGKKRKKKVIPEELVTCAVDLSMRKGSTGFATLSRYRKDKPIDIIRSRNLWIRYKEETGRHPGRWAEGPDLGHIAKHKKEIRILRRKRGKPIKGEQSHIELQQHIDDMGKDRFKKAARDIINFALNSENESGKNGIHPRADILILEKLGGQGRDTGLIPDAEKRERGINRALAGWNRRHLVERVKEMAKDAGLKVYEISPYGTSQVCSKCGAAGRRYSIAKNEETHQREIRFGFVEKLFACPCGYCANADHNASVNLHKRFLLDDQNFYDSKKHKEAAESIEASLIEKLNSMHRISNNSISK